MAQKEQAQKDGAKRTPSPYDLNANDNPGNVITQVQLRGENYEEWAQAIRISLHARRKWGFLDESLTQPKEGSSEVEDWWQSNPCWFPGS